MIIVQLAQLFTSMATYDRLRMIIGEKKVVSCVHADALWDICGGDVDDCDTGHTNDSLSEGGQCRYHVPDSQGCVSNKAV